MRDRDVLERDVELGGAADEVGADAGGDGLALCDELGGIELGDDGFEDFVPDGGEDALVVVETEALEGGIVLVKCQVGELLGRGWRQCLIRIGEMIGLGTKQRSNRTRKTWLYLVNFWQFGNVWSMQHPQRQADHLQILAASRSRDVPGFGADVVDDGFLQPRDQKMCALVDYVLLDSG